MTTIVLPFQWIVEAQGGFRNVPIVDQNMQKTADGSPPEDAVKSCGAAAVCSLAKWERKVELYPDEVKDRILGQNVAGPTTADQLQGFLLSEIGLHNTRIQPTSQASFQNAVYSYLRRGLVLLNLVFFEQPGATARHWRLIVAQTDIQQISTDSQLVQTAVESYDLAWQMAQGAVVDYGTPLLIGIDRLPDVT